MKIYRVESQEGFGMYGSDQDITYVFGTSRASPRHPMAERDSALVEAGWHIEEYNWVANGKWYSPACPTGHPYKDWDAKFDGTRFGFASLEQLKFWIYKTTWRQRLHDKGYHVKVYETQDAIAGDTQAVFNAEAEDIKVVDTLDILTLEPVEKTKETTK